MERAATKTTSACGGLLESCSLAPSHHMTSGSLLVRPGTSIHALRNAGYGESALLGFLFGFLLKIGSLYWVLEIQHFDLLRFSDSLVFLLALYFMIFGFAYALLCRRISRLMIIAAPALWVTLEYARSNLLFPGMALEPLAIPSTRSFPSFRLPT